MMLRQDLQVQNDLLQSDPHFQDVVLHIIYVIRTTMYRCSGKYFYYACILVNYQMDHQLQSSRPKANKLFSFLA